MTKNLYSLSLSLLFVHACNHDVSVIRRDDDGDGYYGEDCDDHDINVNPGAEEVCDGVDNDCDGEVDEELTQVRYPDSDGDGFGVEALAESVCGEPTGYVGETGDCDDSDAAIYPDATEICDSLDNDCDGLIDEELAETWYADLDGDGHADPDSPHDFCDPPTAGYLQEPLDDCDDTDAWVYPEATEICGDEIDQDCDGSDRFCAIQGELELDADANISIYGAQSGDVFGRAVRFGPDFGDDGRIDLLIGAPLSNAENGAFYSIALGEGVESGVIQMPSSGSSTYSAQLVNTQNIDSWLGSDIASIGDVDGDGLGDLMVAAPEAKNLEGPYDGTPRAGASYLFLADEFSSVELATDDADMIIYGQTARATSSTNSGSLGDLNGDGYPELFVAEPLGDSDWSNDSGNVYIFQSCAPGIGGCWDVDGDGTEDVVSSWGPGSFIEVENSDAVLGGNSSGDQVGSAVLAIDDLHGDGTTTLAIGAAGIHTVYLVGDYPFSSTRLDSAADTLLVGAATEADGLGTSLASGGDLNADGYTDLILGAPGEDSGAGRVYIVFGRSQSDFDAFGGTMDLTAWADAEFTGDNAGDAVGTSISGIGDQNLDGCDDFIVGAPGVDYDGLDDAGAVYLLLGHATDMGLGIAELAHLSGSLEDGALGSAIDGTGDLDGDGFPDLLIGAPGYNETGAVFVLFGGAL